MRPVALVTVILASGCALFTSLDDVQPILADGGPRLDAHMDAPAADAGDAQIAMDGQTIDVAMDAPSPPPATFCDGYADAGIDFCDDFESESALGPRWTLDLTSATASIDATSGSSSLHSAMMSIADSNLGSPHSHVAMATYKYSTTARTTFTLEFDARWAIASSTHDSNNLIALVRFEPWSNSVIYPGGLIGLQGASTWQIGRPYDNLSSVDISLDTSAGWHHFKLTYQKTLTLVEDGTTLASNVTLGSTQAPSTFDAIDFGFGADQYQSSAQVTAHYDNIVARTQ